MAQNSPQIDENLETNTHAEFLKLMPKFRSELSARYEWFIHETPFSNLSGIKKKGLLPMQDARPPEEVSSYFGTADVPILCLHPLGSQLCPRGAENSLGSRLIDGQSQNMTVAAKATAERKVFAHLS